MAGLPRMANTLLFASLFLLLFSALSLGQDVQTVPVVIDPIIDTQSDSSALDPVIELIEANPLATAEQQQALIDAFQAAVDRELLTVEVALEMLVLIEWDTIADEEALDLRYTTLLDVLSGVLDETITEPVTELAAALNEALTPPGVLNALGKAGVDEAGLDRVAELVAGGLPPGIVVRVVKDALREGLLDDQILDRLTDLELATQDAQSWGQAANEVTGKGEFKYQDTEQNKNQDENEEPEEETNTHGSQGSEGKAVGKDKDKDKK